MLFIETYILTLICLLANFCSFFASFSLFIKESHLLIICSIGTKKDKEERKVN